MINGLYSGAGIWTHNLLNVSLHPYHHGVLPHIYLTYYTNYWFAQKNIINFFFQYQTQDRGKCNWKNDLNKTNLISHKIEQNRQNFYKQSRFNQLLK